MLCEDLKGRIKFAIMVWLIVALVLWFASLTTGCSEGYEDGWSWGMTTENGGRETAMLRWESHEVRVDSSDQTPNGVVWIPDNAHKLCEKSHYHDPYTKIEYCLPEGFRNIELLHLYRVGK